MKFTNNIQKPIFQPVSVTITFETEEELYNMKRILRLNKTLPDVVNEAMHGTKEEKTNISNWFYIFMINFCREIPE